MRQVPLFSSCTKQDLTMIGPVSEERHVPAGTELCTQGEAGSEFFLILDGAASVWRDAAEIDLMGPGSSFGELALLTQLPRNATVTLTEDSDLLVIHQRDFHRLLDEVPGLAHRLLTVVARRLHERDRTTLTH
jgi:CRP-like cAMP-binding protein